MHNHVQEGAEGVRGRKTPLNQAMDVESDCGDSNEEEDDDIALHETSSVIDSRRDHILSSLSSSVARERRNEFTLSPSSMYTTEILSEMKITEGEGDKDGHNDGDDSLNPQDDRYGAAPKRRAVSLHHRGMDSPTRPDTYCHPSSSLPITTAITASCPSLFSSSMAREAAVVTSPLQRDMYCEENRSHQGK